MRRLQKVIGYAPPPPNSLLVGGMRVMKKPPQTRTRIRKKTITMRRVMQDRIDRQSRRLMFNVMGHRINAETITAVLSTAFAACVASVFGGILSPLYPTAIFVVLAGYVAAESNHYDNTMRDVAWIQVFLREMARIITAVSTTSPVYTGASAIYGPTSVANEYFAVSAQSSVAISNLRAVYGNNAVYVACFDDASGWWWWRPATVVYFGYGRIGWNCRKKFFTTTISRVGRRTNHWRQS